MSRDGKPGLSDPDVFPHRLSFDEDLVSFLRVTRQALRDASFLDGRTDIATGPPELVAMQDVLAWRAEPAYPDRCIFHMSFCGSTLLSRLLDVPGRTIALREPQCLSDLASRQAMLDNAERADRRVAAMLPCLRSLLGRRWSGAEAVIVKPSNWANNLLGAFCVQPAGLRPLFMGADARSFLIAIFRAGDERIAYTARSAVHFSSAGRKNAELVAAALAGDAPDTTKLARLAALVHRMQSDFFAEAVAKGGWSEECRIDLSDLMADPLGTAIRAARHLDLDLPEPALRDNIARWLPQYAKQPGSAYSVEARGEQDRATETRFGREIEEALAWEASRSP